MSVKSFFFYGLKVLEVVLALCCIALVMYPIRGISRTKREIACSWMMTFGATCFVSLTILVGYLIEGIMWKWGIFTFLLCDAILNCIAGALILKDWEAYDSEYIVVEKRKYLNMMLATAILALFNTFIHILDIFTLLVIK